MIKLYWTGIKLDIGVIMKILNYKNQIDIKSISDWREHCPPKNPDKQWIAGASAYELADEYTKNGPISIENLFNIRFATVQHSFDIAYPEYETRFDNFGQGRVHDLLIKGVFNNQPAIFAIEGKVNESFGTSSLQEYYWKSKVNNLKGSNSKICNRIETLMIALFGDSIPSNVGEIKYQLLTALFGTLYEANLQKINSAFLIFQVFNSSKAKQDNIRKNHKELNKLFNIIDSRNKQIYPNEILGPYKFSSFKKIELYIGYLYTG